MDPKDKKNANEFITFWKKEGHIGILEDEDNIMDDVDLDQCSSDASHKNTFKAMLLKNKD